MKRDGLTYFSVVFRETDLWVGVDVRSFSVGLPGKVLHKIKIWRNELDAYIEKYPEFLRSLAPVSIHTPAPPLAHIMGNAAALARVGPMAAVAGAFAQAVGEYLRNTLHVAEVIVENGGDVYLDTAQDARIGIYAGASPLSGKLALHVPQQSMPLGVCTSAGTVGPSLSLGKTDATVTVCHSAALADAYATTLGNLVKNPSDMEEALAIGQKLPNLLGCVIIIGDRLGAWGDIELMPVSAEKRKGLNENEIDCG